MGGVRYIVDCVWLWLLTHSLNSFFLALFVRCFAVTEFKSNYGINIALCMYGKIAHTAWGVLLLSCCFVVYGSFLFIFLCLFHNLLALPYSNDFLNDFDLRESYFPTTFPIFCIHLHTFLAEQFFMSPIRKLFSMLNARKANWK